MHLDGTYNFRDTGGMPLTDGGSTLPGVLYRSDALDALTTTGLDELAESPIGVIVDFRREDERSGAPDRLPTSRSFRGVQLSLLEGSMAGMAQSAIQGATGNDPDAMAAAMKQVLASLPTMGELYISMLTHGAEVFARVARLIAASKDDEPTAVLVHCTAGKDRTGVSVALMLDAVGAVRESIVADYAASQANLAQGWTDAMLAKIEGMGVPITPALRTLITETPPAAIIEALDWVEANHGGSVAYLRSGGLSADELAGLRARLTGS